MTPTDPPLDIVRLTEEADAILSRVFQRGRDVDLQWRFLLYVHLLNRPGWAAPGFQRYTGRTPVYPGEALAGLRDAADPGRFGEILSLLSGATYTAASYWSPIDKRRHTVYHADAAKAFAPDHLASSWTFYALTFLGARLSQPLTSLIHYTATMAPQKRGLLTAFVTTAGDGRGRLILPADLQEQLLSELGIDKAISRVRTSLNDGGIENGLYALLSNLDPLDAEPILKAGISDTFFSEFHERLTSASDRCRDVLRRAHETVVEFFDDSAVSEAQTSFMVALQYLWRRACVSNYMYAFPTVVSDTCCMLTVGTDEPLTPTLHVAVAKIAQSLFAHPLFLDYGARDIESESNRRGAVLRRFFVHNLPKLLITPTAVELERVEKEIGDSIGDTGVTRRISLLRRTFEHYEKVLLSLSASDRRLGAFGGALELVDVADVVRDVEAAIELSRLRVLDEGLRRSLSVACHGDTQGYFLGHDALLKEMLFNLISNAAEALDPRAVAKDPSCAQIDLDIRKTERDGQRYWDFTVRDRGTGMSAAAKERLEAINRSVQATSIETFYSTIATVIEKPVASLSYEEHMGIGLLFACAYLRSLEWQSAIARRGELLIKSEPGAGTSVTVRYATVDAAAPQAERIPTRRATILKGPGADGQSPQGVLVTSNEATAREFVRTFDANAVYMVRTADDLVPDRVVAHLSPTTVVVVDGELLGGGDFFRGLRQSDLRSIKAAFDDGALPASLNLIRALGTLGTKRPTVLLLRDPPAPLTYCLYQFGIQWVWPNESFGPGFLDVIHGLARPRKPKRIVRPAVFVVENSRSVCMALKARLEDIVTPLFVGSDKPAVKFAITKDEAERAFDELEQTHTVAAAIIDLALSEEAEDTAVQLSSQDRLGSLMLRAGGTIADYHDVFGGIGLVIWLREKRPNLPVFVFSSFLDPNVTIGLMRALEEDGIEPPYPIDKSEPGYRMLRTEIARLITN